MQKPILLLLAVLFSTTTSAQFIYGDLLPDAPALSARGVHAVGVRSMTITNPDQLNVAAAKDGVIPTYDRPLDIEIWYPAEADPDATITYEETMGQFPDTTRPLIPFTFLGRATRGAKPKASSSPYPLVVVSHGYTGSKYLMTYLTENLASKGYVVVAIAHTESTFDNAGPFAATLYYRPIDVRFTVDQIQGMSAPEAGTFLSGLTDASNTAIIGYSMGGYGVLNVGGAGYSPGLAAFFGSQTGDAAAIGRNIYGNDAYPGADPRVKAVVAFAPWGMRQGIWEDEGLKGLSVPTFLIAGSEDDISGYENGVRAIFEGATKTERYLLTYEGARHNVAPNPPPPEALAPGLHIDEYLRYADSVWDTKRMNNINQHFITAFIDGKLKGIDTKQYLDLPADANTNSWEGFKPRTAVGLTLEK